MSHSDNRPAPIPLFVILLLMAGVVLAIVTSVWWQQQQRQDYVRQLSGQALPTDLPDYQHQLRKLTLEGEGSRVPLRGLPWLKAPLHSLTLIDMPELTRLANLPATLTELHLESTGIVDLRDIIRLPRLRSLTLIRNFQLGTLDGLDRLPRLTRLRLSNNRTLDDFTILQRLTGLTALDLSDSRRFTTLQDLQGLQALTELNVSRTGLRDLTGIDRLSALTRLDISRLQIRELQGIEQLAQLRVLNLSDNRSLQDMSGIGQLRQLRELDLSGNRVDLTGLQIFEQLHTLDLTGVPQPDLTTLAQMQGLRSLRIRIDPARLTQLNRLTRLNLSNDRGFNRIGSLAPLDALDSLILVRTGVTALDGLEQFQQLRVLDLSQNSLMYDHSATWDAPHEEGIRQISDFPQLAALAALEELYLSSVGLHSTPKNGLHGIETLQRLQNWI
jgi:Leucine-rich repeat (LRR) protein